LEDTGFKDWEDVKNNLTPMVPLSIRIFCSTFNVFKNPMDVHNLIPMIYTYWC
jgi:hypothetical protein